MRSGANVIVLTGHLGKKPEMKVSKQGHRFAVFSLAHQQYTPGNPQGSEVCWYSVSIFGRQAENCVKFLDKGSPVLVEGRFSAEKWKDAQGQERVNLRVSASQVLFLGARPRGEAPPEEASFGNAMPF